MKEFNNRTKAKSLAEFITGDELRKYLAYKVKRYVGDNPTVFDGAIGSGQLEQYLNASYIHGVEIQKEACEVFLENYENATVDNVSFFNYEKDLTVDCVVMNYPFSLKFKDLSDVEKENIQNEFPWKKSGVVDDIFILKSLKYTKRFAFYIGFPGITYRQNEQKLRDLIGNQLVELNTIENAFDDTSISVVFLIIDKEKTTQETYKEIYDCKLKKVIGSETYESKRDRWFQHKIFEEPEKIDIIKLNKEIKEHIKKRRYLEDKLDKFIQETFHSDGKDEKQISIF